MVFAYTTIIPSIFIFLMILSIEVWYSPDANEIEKIKILDDEKKLDLYIQQMNKLDKQNHKI